MGLSVAELLKLLELWLRRANGEALALALMRVMLDIARSCAAESNPWSNIDGKK